MPYVIERWPGGMLTNFTTIRKAVKKMDTIDKMETDGTMDNMSKREKLQLSRQRAKLEKNLGSIKNLNRLPSALFVVDVLKEHIAVAEANRLGIPVFGIVDTNSDPTNVDFAIPANDDASKSIDIILATVCEAIKEGLEERKAEQIDNKDAEADDEEVKEAPKPRRQRVRRPAAAAEEAPKAEEAAARDMTGAGLSDCKKALIESDNDITKAMELIRKRGQAIAAKREDRQAAQGIAIGKTDGKFAAIIALKCETDFVAKNEKFVNLAKAILDLAMAQKPANLDELNALQMDGKAVSEQITALSGITGEKMELGAYECLNAPSTVVYNHFNGMLSAAVAFNQENVAEDVAKAIAMQVASMNPIKATREQIPQEVIDEELRMAVDKTRAEQVSKAVENALKKAGFNPYYCATEEHRDEAIRKGYMTEAQVAEALKLMDETAKQKEANMPEQMIQNIAQGRLNKFYQENVLMEQVYEAGENKETVAQFLVAADKDLKAIDLKRVNLNVD